MLEVLGDGGDDDGCCCEVGEEENCSCCVVVRQRDGGDDRQECSGDDCDREPAAGSGDGGDGDTEDRPDERLERKRSEWDLFGVDGEADVCRYAERGDQIGDDRCCATGKPR